MYKKGRRNIINKKTVLLRFIVYILIINLLLINFTTSCGLKIKNNNTININPINNNPIIQSFKNETTLTVGGSGQGNYTKIQDAVNAANPGDTVFVYKYGSPYNENILINKPIKLIGEPSRYPVISGQNLSQVITVESFSVLIMGFKIMFGLDGVWLKTNSYNCTVAHNIICNNFMWGVNIYGAITKLETCNLIFGNTIKDNGNPNIVSGGVYIALSFRNLITHNNFYNNTFHGFFFLSIKNKWTQNYWESARILPYPIMGILSIVPQIFWLNFDFNPRSKPYEIKDAKDIFNNIEIVSISNSLIKR